MIWVAHGLGALGLVFGVLRYQMKTAFQIRLVSVIATAFFALHYIGFGAWSGLIFCSIAVTRGSILLHPKLFEHRRYIAAITICVCVIALWFTYKQWTDVLPFLGLVIGTFRDIQTKAIMARGFGFMSVTMWIIFNAFLGSWTALINDLLIVASNIIGTWRHHLRPYLKTGDKSVFDI